MMENQFCGETLRENEQEKEKWNQFSRLFYFKEV